MVLKDRYPRLPPGCTPSDIDRAVGEPCSHDFPVEPADVEPDAGYVYVYTYCREPECMAQQTTTYAYSCLDDVDSRVWPEVLEDFYEQVEWGNDHEYVEGEYDIGGYLFEVELEEVCVYE